MEQSSKTQFGGDKKKGTSLLHIVERPFIDWAVPRLPRWIKSYELTLLTVVWSIAIVFLSFLAKDNIAWLWGVSFCIFLQWLTDSLDGSLGKTRGEGLIRWGFYMDHFLDYIFLCSILIGYLFIFPSEYTVWLFFTLAIFGAFMVNSYLSFGATNEFQIAYLRIGPTEIRLVFIFINTLLIIFGKTYLAPALPWVLIISIIGLWAVVYRTGKYIHNLDMKHKKEHSTHR
ncbi:MAG: hypothetical protein COU30_02790 [Candidatus Magasanikbacteria bacterium CG10_big_fil_rev_8_21_14_0_10_38_6]|uniref:CDP-alcohol phosphatidyltransferase n=1 Tax=Candidatus Magasanikbacteria bacterium CG10_big_fil_rev_8_21_14_0_10_38_6 TaxID=1974647 RepID=A0A2M6P0X9_9BACT|nr:MAG: hypothetical protein COU30_02790 [Candidatus Magasanikbacteria bacterium CG10_big_fil_rev_8_21_14_0_10_38_6]